MADNKHTESTLQKEHRGPPEFKVTSLKKMATNKWTGLYAYVLSHKQVKPDRNVSLPLPSCSDHRLLGYDSEGQHHLNQISASCPRAAW